MNSYLLRRRMEKCAVPLWKINREKRYVAPRKVLAIDRRSWHIKGNECATFLSITIWQDFIKNTPEQLSASVPLNYIVLLYKNAFRMILATFFNSKEVTPYIILHRISQIYQVTSYLYQFLWSAKINFSIEKAVINITKKVINFIFYNKYFLSIS